MSRPATSACATATPGGGAAYSSFASTSCAATATTSTPARTANPGRCGAGSGPISAKANRYPASSMWTCRSSGGTVGEQVRPVQQPQAAHVEQRGDGRMREHRHRPGAEQPAQGAGAFPRQRTQRQRHRCRRHEQQRGDHPEQQVPGHVQPQVVPAEREHDGAGRRRRRPRRARAPSAAPATPSPVPRAAATYATAAAASAATSSSASTSAAGPSWVTPAAGRPGS